MTQIFLSYASEDEVVVRKVREQLTLDGIRTWLAARDIPPGEDWEARIRETLRKVAAVLVFLSEASVGEESYVHEELRLALERSEHMPAGRVFVIPVRIDECAIPTTLGHLQVIDLYPSGISEIVRLLKDEDVRLKRAQGEIVRECSLYVDWEQAREDAIKSKGGEPETMQAWQAASERVWPGLSAEAERRTTALSSLIRTVTSLREGRILSAWRVVTLHAYLAMAYSYSASYAAAGLNHPDNRSRALEHAALSLEECGVSLDRLRDVEADPDSKPEKFLEMRHTLLWYVAKAKAIDVYCGGTTTPREAIEAAAQIQGEPLDRNRPWVNSYLRWFTSPPAS